MRGRYRRALVLTVADRARACGGLRRLFSLPVPIAGRLLPGWADRCRGPDAPDRSRPFHDGEGKPVREGEGKPLLRGKGNRVPFNAGAGFVRSDAGKT